MYPALYPPYAVEAARLRRGTVGGDFCVALKDCKVWPYAFGGEGEGSSVPLEGFLFMMMFIYSHRTSGVEHDKLYSPILLVCSAK